MTMLDEAHAATEAADTAEEVISRPMALMQASLGDRAAHRAAGALPDGQDQFLVGGAFLVTPGAEHLMLVGNTGFPPEQTRLCIPIDAGDPGRVIASAAPLLLPDTHVHGGFRQYLKTARMGSAAYAPLLRDGVSFGLIIVAALARNTLRQADLDQLTALAPAIARRWDAVGGATWLEGEFARATATGEAFFAAREGVNT